MMVEANNTARTMAMPMTLGIPNKHINVINTARKAKPAS